VKGCGRGGGRGRGEGVFERLCGAMSILMAVAWAHASPMAARLHGCHLSTDGSHLRIKTNYHHSYPGGAESDPDCIVCPSNSDSEPGSSSCQCNAGFTRSTCTACSAGKYKAITGSGACTDCGTVCACARAKLESIRQRRASTLHATSAAPESTRLRRESISHATTALRDSTGSRQASTPPVMTAKPGSTQGKYKATAGVNTACDACVKGKYSTEMGTISSQTCAFCRSGKLCSLSEQHCMYLLRQVLYYGGRRRFQPRQPAAPFPLVDSVVYWYSIQ
jgi:hypothetical protein